MINTDESAELIKSMPANLISVFSCARKDSVIVCFSVMA